MSKNIGKDIIIYISIKITLFKKETLVRSWKYLFQKV